MNKEEILENISILDDKDIFEKLDKSKELRDWFLVELNVSLQRSESIVANIKDRRELRCYKNALTSLQVENQELKNQQKEFIEYLEKEKERCLTFYSSTPCMYAYDVFKDVLSKYQEITGVENER